MNLQDDSKAVLLVEDDEVDIKTIKYGFKEFNIQNKLVIVSNGVEALNLLKGECGITKLTPPPSAILLDINMPKMNGFEFLSQLKKLPEFASIPVFIITTSDADFDKTAAESFAVDGYFVKPLQFTEFLPSYSHALESA